MDDSSTATMTRDCDPSTSSYAFSGKLMLISVLTLLIVILFILFFHVYARCFFFRRSRNHQPHRINRRPRHLSETATLPAAAPHGLDISLLKSLPIFHYASTTNGLPLECAVCLSEFQEKERGRLLPRCNHCFHLDCIDMWFHSHSNCPLCRSPVPPIISPDEIRLPMSTATEPAGSEGGPDEPVRPTVGVRDTNDDVGINIEDVDLEVGNGNGVKPGAGAGAGTVAIVSLKSG